MSVSGQGTIWNLPGYTGELLSVASEKTPLLTMMGGLSNGGKLTNNFEFPLNANFTPESASQPAITETDSLKAPTAVETAIAQEKNVTQIFHEAINVSYAAQSNAGRLSGINSAGAVNSVTDQVAFQIQRKLVLMAKKFEYCLLRGSYQIATDADTANKMRGVNEAASDASNTVDADGAALDKALIDALLLLMDGNNADFMNMFFVVNLVQKQKLSKVFGYAPTDRNVGGVNIKQLETDIGNIGVLLHPMQSTSVVTLLDMAHLAPVWQPTPGKGNFFYEALAKTGASENGQLFGQASVSYGAGRFHGTITDLATS